MPLKDGTLTDEEFGMVAGKLVKFWSANPDGRPPCPSCGSREFFIHPALLGNRSDTVSISAQHTRMPTVAVYCKKCGHVTHHVARLLGIDVLQVGENSNEK